MYSYLCVFKFLGPKTFIKEFTMNTLSQTISFLSLCPFIVVFPTNPHTHTHSNHTQVCSSVYCIYGFSIRFLYFLVLYNVATLDVMYLLYVHLLCGKKNRKLQGRWNKQQLVANALAEGLFGSRTGLSLCTLINWAKKKGEEKENLLHPYEKIITWMSWLSFMFFFFFL